MVLLISRIVRYTYIHTPIMDLLLSFLVKCFFLWMSGAGVHLVWSAYECMYVCIVSASQLALWDIPIYKHKLFPGLLNDRHQKLHLSSGSKVLCVGAVILEKKKGSDATQWRLQYLIHQLFSWHSLYHLTWDHVKRHWKSEGPLRLFYHLKLCLQLLVGILTFQRALPTVCQRWKVFQLRWKIKYMLNI